MEIEDTTYPVRMTTQFAATSPHRTTGLQLTLALFPMAGVVYLQTPMTKRTKALYTTLNHSSGTGNVSIKTSNLVYCTI